MQLNKQKAPKREREREEERGERGCTPARDGRRGAWERGSETTDEERERPEREKEKERKRDRRRTER